MAQFCPQCGAQLAPGQSFCPVCGASVAPQQPQPPQYQQAPPQYQQAPPQYQQPQYQQYQPVDGPAPAPVKPPVKNLWSIITGSTVAFFCFLTLVFAIVCLTSIRNFSNLHSLMGVYLFFCGVGITVYFLAQRPFSAALPQNEKMFSLAFMISNVVAWLFVLVAFIIIRSADVLFIFAALAFAAAGVFGYLSFKNLLKETGNLTWGFLATMLTIAVWFLISVFSFSGAMGLELLGFGFVVTSLALGGATAAFMLHYLKAPETKLF